MHGGSSILCVYSCTEMHWMLLKIDSKYQIFYIAS